MEQLNFLSPTGFLLSIDKLPQTCFHCVEINHPLIETGLVEISAPMLNYGFPCYKLTFGELHIKFVVDEDMQNYYEISNWLFNIDNPFDFSDNKLFYDSYKVLMSGDLLSNICSDATLSILSNSNNPSKSIIYTGLYPLSIGNIEMHSNENDLIYKTCDATFKISTFTS